MLSYSAYKVIHIFGLVTMFVALGAACRPAEKSTAHKLTGILHGVGALLSLVGGFGLLARLDLGEGFPMWVLAKLVLWLVLVASIAIPRRKPEWSSGLHLLIPALALLAIYLAVYKPF